MPDLTIRQLAALIGRHPETLRRLARMKRLPGAYRLGGQWLITEKAANALRRLPDDGQAEAEGGNGRA